VNFEAKLVTVQQVSVTPDLKQAHVYIGVIGSEDQRRAAMAQLHDKRRALQSEIGRRVTFKYTPQLHFVLDNTVERGTRILNILEDLHLPPEESADDSEHEAHLPGDENR
jgi:ribosome-binding factor A